MCRNGRVRDPGGGGAHQHFSLRVVFADHLGNAALHFGANLRGGQNKTVVAVYRALNPARPGEGLVRPEENCADLQKGSRDRNLT